MPLFDSHAYIVTSGHFESQSSYSDENKKNVLCDFVLTESGMVRPSGTCQTRVFVWKVWLLWDSGRTRSRVKGGCGDPVTRHHGRAGFPLRDGC